MNVKSGICSLSRSHSRMFSVSLFLSLFLFRQWISVPLLATKNAQMRLSIQRCKKIVATTLIDLPRFGAFSSVLCWPIHLCFRSISFNLFIKLWIYIVNFRKLPPTKAPKASGFVCVCVFKREVSPVELTSWTFSFQIPSIDSNRLLPRLDHYIGSTTIGSHHWEVQP